MTTAHAVFTLAVGGNYFMEIAKLRAIAHMLWANIVEQYGPSNGRQQLL
jgi:methylmalonyl-CoA mutase N-terminal domain/subunit